MMILSPVATQRAAGPFKQIIPLPGSPGIVYVSKRLPLLTSTICTCSYSKIPAASNNTGSTVILPT